MSTNTFEITKCDNELIFIAYQWQASYEILRVLSGNSQEVNVSVPINTGAYLNPTTLNGIHSPSLAHTRSHFRKEAINWR